MINKVTLMGRIGKKEFKQTKNGSHVCNLSIATSRKYLDSKGDQQEKTTWHNVNFFNKLAEISDKYASVGDIIYIEGEISNRKIDENGVTRIVHSIIGNEIKFIPQSRKNNETKENKQEEIIPWTESDDSDIPF